MYMFLFYGKEVMNNGGGGLLGIYTGAGIAQGGGGSWVRAKPKGGGS